MEVFKYESKLGYKIIFYYDKSNLNISIVDKIKFGGKKNIFSQVHLRYKDNYNHYNKYISDFTDLINKIKANENEIDINLEEKTNFEPTREKDGKALEKKENIKNIRYLILKIVKITINEEIKSKVFIEQNIYILNVEYYLTSGPDNKRKNSFPFYSYLEKNEFNSDDIEKFIEKEEILHFYDIDCCRYYNRDKNAFQIITSETIPIKGKLIIEFHFNKILNNCLANLKLIQKYMNDKLENLKNKINKYSEITKKYDLIFLYASPILNKDKEFNECIEYTKEIRNIIHLMKNRRKKFNCIFECAGFDIFSEVLMKKKTKILHISSHGSLDENCNYSLCLENLQDSGKLQKIELSKLRDKLELNKNKIKELDLVIVSTCHSQDFGKLFLEYGAKNVIYIYKKTPIFDNTSIKFTEYFYENLLEGYSIKDSYNKAIEILKLDKNIEIPCCCQHFHKKNCELKKYLKLKEQSHFEGCKKSCKCKFVHINEHNCKECQYYLNLSNYLKTEKKFNNDVVSICCCDNDIIHDEVLKIIYENNEPKSNQNICPFKYNENGEVSIESNISFYYDPEKILSTIGRKPTMGKIFNNIKKNYDNLDYTILYGGNELLIKEFSESIGVYLYERKIINSFRIYKIKTKFDYIYVKNKIVENSEINSRKKNVKIINFEIDEKSEENCFEYLKNIIELFCLNYNYNIYNLYFIFILITNGIQKENQEKLIMKYIQDYQIKINRNEEYKNLFYAGYGKNGAELLLKYLIKNNNISLSNEQIQNLLNKANYLPMNIKLIAKLLLEKVSYNEIIERKQLKKTYNKLNELEDDLYNLYFILLNMPSGLPDSFLQLIFKDYVYINDEKKLMDRYPENNWNYIKNNQEFHENFQEIKNRDSTYRYLLKILKIYISLLNYFIDRKRKKISNISCNIHYIYNPYKYILNLNNKTNIDVKKILGKKILHKDFSIQMHKKNILNLISLIVNNINLFRQICSNELDILLEAILLLLPSYFFLKRDCITILKSCINFCNKLIESNKDGRNDENQTYLKQKLLLFLFSINESEDEILKIKNLRADLEIEKNILIAMRLKKEKRKQLFELLNDEKINYEKKYNLYYEISSTFFQEEKYEDCIKYLKLALDSNNINDMFKNRILIDSCIVFKKCFIKNIRENFDLKNKNKIVLDEKQISNEQRKSYELIMEKIDSLNIILKKVNIRELYYESYYLKEDLYNLFLPDVVILNSNPLKNNFGYINCRHNNQYYILNQIQNSINSFIKIKSNILNRENLDLALNRKGEILIIQTDDFTENGDIVCENDNGESEIISTTEIFNNHDFINYKVIILCFPKSSKLIDFFNRKIDYNYLITFEDFNYSFNDVHIMKKYNKIMAQFIIDFIKLSAEKNNQNNDIEEDIFLQAKNNFIKEINKDIISENYIILSKNPNKEIPNLKIIFSEGITDNQVFLYDSLIKLDDNKFEFINEYCDYTQEIHELVVKINNENRLIINCNKSNKLKWTQISFEVLKYFYRHKTYCEFYHIDIREDGKQFLSSIIKKLNKMWNNEIEDNDDQEIEENNEIIKQKLYFILITNCKLGEMLDINIYSILNCNSSFIIIYDDDEEKDKKFKTINKNSEKINNLDGKTFLIQYSEDEILFADSLTISTSLRNDYGCNFNEINIKYALFNYRSSMTSNGNLFQHIYYGRPFSEEQAKLIFYKILLCLNELHKNNVCHLDLELGNIMLDEYNNPVLINSGTAREATENLKEFDGIINEYTPPELLIKGNNYDYDGKKLDIYDLGVILNKLVTGEKPTNPPNYNNNQFSDEFKTLLNGMVNGNPDERYSIDNIFESKWIKQINEMSKNKTEEYENLEKNTYIELGKKNNDVIERTKMNVKKDMNISSVANSYLKKNISISEIEDNEINKYNNIMIPENINPTDLINHLYNKISSDKIHYNNLIRGQSYSFAVDVKNEVNDVDYDGKGNPIKVELYKIKNEEKYFFRIDKDIYLKGNSDYFYLCIDNIKRELDSIIEEESKNQSD